ncbi:hypothetical protein [Streptomyces sp. NPDC007991]|uniref:hypothetical protein n=1 Tax=Streptomyces sp. NPDC007991 TaxID=3364803 RepID=UPI0036E36018
MTGHEFAQAHGNDSSTWTSADFEAELVLAENDALPAYRFIHARRTKTAQTAAPADLTPAA